MSDHDHRLPALKDALLARVLVLDGAMGTMLQALPLTADDFGGAAHEGCHEILVRTRPDIISGIHRAYLEAGADLIKTNSFGATRLALGEYGLQSETRALNVAAAQLARREADAASGSRFVAGSVGPTAKAISVTGGVTFPELVEAFYEQVEGLVAGGVDLLLLETCHDTRNLKAALRAVHRLERETGRRTPVMVSITIEPTGTMLAGQTVEALCAAVSHAELFSLGINCATGPEFMTDYIRTLSELSPFPVSCHPNAGLPDEAGRYSETPASLAAVLERFVDHGWLNIVGGCCGTTDAHVNALAQMAAGKRPRRPAAPSHRAFYSGLEAVEATDANRPLIVGERSNVVGSKAFRQLVAQEQWDEATEVARRQVRNGANIADVCLQSMDRDEVGDVPLFYERLIRKVKVPIMIDTTNAAALELALTYCQGKSIINSVNLEDGEEGFRRVVPIARQYGAALVVGCIDEDPLRAQAFTRERKLSVAQRAYDLLTGPYGIAPEDILIDPLVFPCGVGDANYVGGAVETIEAIRLIKQALPHVRTILGISNISFGLPPLGREIVNSVFLYHCVKAGLDLAIVNAEKLERFASIPEFERRLAESLLFNAPATAATDASLRTAPEDWRAQTPEQRAALNRLHIDAIVEHFRASTRPAADRRQVLTPDQHVTRCVVEGTKDGLVDSLDRLLEAGALPLDVINGPLMAGMSEVGRLFGDNQLIVAEVLQSAEVMKAAVNHLEPRLRQSEAGFRGTVVLATVKGDVHDIGKNLVEIILSNNGYRVVNLGLKVPPDALIQACATHRPDAIGLSGLLVKSAQQMVATAADLRQAGIRVPLLVGGAALSERFAKTAIGPAYGEAVCYARDAMAGLSFLNRLMDIGSRESALREHRFGPATGPAPSRTRAPIARSTARSPRIRIDVAIPSAPYLDRRVYTVPNLADVWTYLNPHLLFERQLGYRGSFEQALSSREPKAVDLHRRIEDVKDVLRRSMTVKATWQFFEAERDGNAIQVFSPGGESPIQRFEFPRAPGIDGHCLSDYVLDSSDGRRDHLALFVVTAGTGIVALSEELKRTGEFLRAHAVQALALETAEATAEWLHRRLREDWGFPDPSSLSMHDRFLGRYRGKRYSPGYPACPNLDDQRRIFALLHPEDIGVQLTDNLMMDPEASVSAFVFHHPDAAYFSVSAGEREEGA